MYKEPKYRTILESTKEELNKLRNISLNDKYKPLFHIHPQHGLLNDPNGLADFVNWNREDVALIPIESYESHGAYSGNAIEVDGKLHMYYTGNIKYSAEDRYAYQNLAIMDKDGKITKYENNPIVSEIPKGYTGHVRDPKVFKRKDKYFMLLGAQTSDKKGVIIVYESKNSIDWNFKGELNVKNIDEDFGYMWECPDYINIDEKDILIFSPQGVESKGFDYQNIYNVVYAIGNMDLDNLTFQIDIMKEMEKGFDFYAPQTFIKESQIILFAWAGMGEVLYPTDKNKWAHCLTVPRKLNIKNNKLLQMPVDELIKLRYDETSGQNTIKNNINIIENDENVYELNINIKNIDSNKFGLELFSSQDEGVKLEFNKVGNTVTLDRSNFKKVFGVEYGTNRKEYINIDENTNIKVLADRSILEIFINDGEVVFTSRIFAKENSNQIRVYSDKIVEYKYTKFKLKQGIEL
ncbi:glycoside hydrolase family 32 protein [Clostridioides difficile]|uniref:glycoside hydrolase family 32 protein n=1 Tax=Clostridioides difficile TaxID=1496 RepID=UPI000826A4A0|nr:sucrose-6-phosphate hydrolase [Clostridioides difficile]MDO0136236.1 sucrose-6-phosphate hydrolase [Clostridioides difficile]HBG7259420.1 sucrose-6-phosphate hydrolase [Clostridioides difficile]